MQYEELRTQVYQANMAILKNNLAHLTWGNVSQIDRDAGIIAIKPSGIPYSELSPGGIVLVDLEGETLEGNLKPSSDTKTHLELYQAHKCIGGITHTHSTYASSWAQAQREIPILGTTHADYSVRDIPCTAVMSDEAIERDYEVETGKQILAHLKTRNLDPKEVEMILVACHGPFTWGKNAMKSLDNAIVLEEIAKIAFFSVSLNPNIKPLKETLKAKHYSRKHGSGAYYGQ